MAAADVKYLTFIQRGASSVVGLAESGYCAVKKTTLQVSPKVIQDAFVSAEDRLKPVLGSTLNFSLSILKWADSWVRSGPEPRESGVHVALIAIDASSLQSTHTPDVLLNVYP
jgi:hypothetical protein